jgi:hypothetical protein
MAISGTLTVIRVKNNQRQFVVEEFSPSPLRVCGKVVILQCETQIGFCMD